MGIELFKDCFEMNGINAELLDGYLCFGDQNIPIRHGIPRFTPDVTYSSNFQLLRERHSVLQLDSQNGTKDRLTTILNRTQWPREYFKGKTVLECGCGAGPDTEILLQLGCKVVSVDLVGVDIANKNLDYPNNVQFIQAGIEELPFKKGFFDIVFCHRVLQHTPNPKKVLKHILTFVKDDGGVFVHSYAKTLYQCLRWKYVFLPLTNKLPPRFLYRIIRAYAKILYPATNLLQRTKVGRIFCRLFVPLLNYRYLDKFKNMTDNEMFEYAVHDTFDALSPRYDKPISAEAMKQIGDSILKRPFEVYSSKTITLLRSIPLG